jgi:hypothetical protein
VYNENTADKNVAEIIIAKQRNGPIGKLRLTFLGQYTTFENYMKDSKTAEVNRNAEASRETPAVEQEQHG